MGMVSKDWKQLLNDAPILILDEKNIVEKMTRKLSDEMHRLNPHLEPRLIAKFNERVSKDRFSALVNRVISSSNSTVKINYMCLAFKYELGSENAGFMNSWVRFMMTRDIEKLELSLLQTQRTFLESLDFELPCRPFEPKFTSFMLRFCKLKASRFRAFANLKVLHLCEVIILDSSIGQLLSKCRILEDLKIERCLLSNNFFVCKQDLNIKHLKLIHYTPIYKIDISVPQLILLDFKGVHLVSSTIRNATNLIDCSIDMNGPFIDHSEENFLALLVIDLQHSRTLTLNTWCIQVIQMLDYEHCPRLQGSFTNMKKLTLKLGCLKRELPGIILLLKICHVLENLTLEILKEAKYIDFVGAMQPNVNNFEEDEYLKNQTQVIPCLENRLKDLQIYRFTGKNHEMKLIEFLLQKALVLENLVICNDLDLCSRLQEHGLELQIPIQELLSLPRASSSVQVSINNVAKVPTD